ncbi:aerobic-type carbon monoxide dehydrogenase, large subunit CoxL/CutL-like protein [Terriglobus roseus DSM 18391]|uniref:Aerobic-type carbon monoxide dehydrogenase, large subunit CoxL/CutL-like protein n=1 Tax=Terriglobus roseus (strain DSM 18391 / NRRL B-41598 / KBS 63) TaxID=926566 RepID=I3ZD28_TERRK|nr:xanthine dehydrogenase family protein molybdopterin-binding subunit [Terriglobus roseus]AFL87146.1 aerobic-type carbon monoxide dehydrogenase, large subunit CoxL/CutL-like protein [Terriglobus roseus DSM 18391]
MPDAAINNAPVRIDGHAKITGQGLYTGDVNCFDRYLHPGEAVRPMLHAAVVPAGIAFGRVLHLDTAAAQRLPGVRLVMTPANAPRLKKIRSLLMSEQSNYLPLQDDNVRYHGQPIALVVAQTPEIAREAAMLINATYSPQPALLDFERNLDKVKPAKKVGAGSKGEVKRGDAEAAFATAPIKVDAHYELQPAHHNAIEPGATVAYWHAHDGLANRLTVVSATQFVYGDAVALGEAFGLGVKDKLPRIVAQVLVGKEFDSAVRVIAPLIGGGFGSKGGANHTMLPAMAAKLLGHPVKLVLTRQDTFSQMPYRGGADIRLRLGATPDGKLTALVQESLLQSSETASFLEPTSEVTQHLYAVPNFHATHKVLRLNTNSPGWMRAPGVTPGQFVLETAMDELAEQLSLDPIELRLRNYAEVDPESGKQWSSKSLRECYAQGAEHFGWHRRQARSTEHQGEERIGYGMATAAYPTNHFPATARLILHADGTVVAQSATQEIGQGAITSLSQVVATELALPLDRIRLEIGDTTLPFGAFSAGSSTSLSVGSALRVAAQELAERLARIARVDKASPLYLCALKDITFQGGVLAHRIESARRDPATAVLSRAGRESLEVKGIAGRTFGKSDYARMAFGAQFARVAVNEFTGSVRVTHMTGAFAAGRILNARTARSQLLGGMVWGVGHALLEESLRDIRLGAWVNANLAEAHVPTNADAPDIEVIFVPEDDTRGSELGAKGIGEIGITGVSAAIANAIHNATGRRLRNLPITAEQVLGL